MPSTFAFRAVAPSGRRVSGREPAANATSATASLEARGLVVLDVAESAGTSEWRLGKSRVRKRDVLEFTRSMAALLPAGVPLARALGTSAALVDGRATRVVQDLQQRVEQGAGLAQALEFHADAFGPLYLGWCAPGSGAAICPARSAGWRNSWNTPPHSGIGSSRHSSIRSSLRWLEL